MKHVKKMPNPIHLDGGNCCTATDPNKTLISSQLQLHGKELGQAPEGAPREEYRRSFNIILSL